MRKRKLTMQSKQLPVIFLVLILMFVIGCGREAIYRGVYDGLQNREKMVNPSDEPNPQEEISYDEYKRERDSL